jgi:hypothetical protein
MNRSKLNFWLDVILFVSFLITIASLPGGGRRGAVDTTTPIQQTRVMVHYVAGTLMLVGSALHIALHWEWIKVVILRSPRNLARRVAINRGIDIVLFLLFALCGFTGWAVWPVAEIIPGPSWLSLKDWSDMHRLTGMIMFLILVLHLVLHWKWILSTTRRYLKPVASNIGQRPGQVHA